MKYDKVIQIGNLSKPRRYQNPSRNRLYSVLGISPTINCCGGGQTEPLVLLEYEL